VFDAVQLEQARARFDVIAGQVPLKRVGRELVGLCPFHKEKTPSFALVADKGFFHCFGCGAHGTAIDFVMRTRNLDFAEAVEFLLGVPSQAPKQYRTPHRRAPVDRADDIAKARQIWAEAGTDYRYVPLYLYSRYLSDLTAERIPPTIREHPALFCPVRRAQLPALVAAFQASSGRVTAVQRIWLEERFEGGNDKGSRLPDAKKMAKGVLGDGAMRLAKPGPIMGFAEGLETALAAGRLYSTPTWALGGVSRLGYPAHLTQPTDGSKPRRVESRPPSVWVPDEVRHLFIFGDGNEVGRLVAEFAAEWWNRLWRGTGRRAEAVLPVVGYGDFQDELRVGVIAGAIR
jgi:DNA primase